MYKFLFFLFGAMVFFACQEQKVTKEELPVQSVAYDTPGKGLDKYWYQGKAELNRYVLEQNRYRDIHPGEAVLIFVTEDFRSDIQVKSEGAKPEKGVSTLKLNFLRRFPTGLYDYSIMTSVFTPVGGEEGRTMKVTMSSQDWCGQSFMQLNLSQNSYRVQLRSYFESEGDANMDVPAVLLEDELFNRIRISPEQLPIGAFEMLPSLSIARLMHIESEPIQVNAEAMTYSGKDFEGENLNMYRVNMPSIQRELSIVFEANAPHKIIGWTDQYPSAFDKKPRTTKATLVSSELSPYWSKNSLDDLPLRKEIGFGGTGK